MKEDYYSILGIGKDASEKEIKKAYRKIAIENHPDKVSDKSEEERKACEERFKKATEAYEVLSDKDKRERYDKFGTADEGASYSNMSAEEIFKRYASHFGHMGNGWFDDDDDMNMVQRGRDISVNVTLTLKEAFEGGKKTFTYQRRKRCTHCNGTGLGKDGKIEACPKCGGTGRIKTTKRTPFGFVQQLYTCDACGGKGMTIKNPCEHCGGTGLENGTETYTMDISFGVTDGIAMTVRGMGDYSPQADGECGDMVVVFRVMGKDGITIGSPYNPYDLQGTVNISILDAITGCVKSISAPNGKVYNIQLKAGTENGSILSMNNLGLIDVNGTRHNLLIKVRHVMPKSITDDDRKKLNELKKSKSFKID